MFEFVGAALALYAVHSMLRGEVYARSAVRGRIVARADEPERFWLVVACYLVMAFGFVVVF